LSKRLQEKRTGLLLILPALIIIGLAYYFPTFFSFYMSFHKWFLPQVERSGTQFIGVKNYIDLFLSSSFWYSLFITVYYVIISVGISFIFGLIEALVLNQGFRGRGWLRGIFLLPWALSPLVAGFMWEWIYHPSYGSLNSLLLQLGVVSSPIRFLSSTFLALNSIIFVDIWQWTPFIMVVLLAGLQVIPQELYESAKIDGANVWERFRHITIPLLVPIIYIVLFLRIAWSFRLFDLVYVLTRGGPGSSTKVLTYFAYEQAFSYLKMGAGSAIGFTVMFLSLIVLAIFSYLFKGRKTYEI